MADSVAARKPPNLSGFAHAQTNCIRFCKQFRRGNQESFTSLKQYRPFCYAESVRRHWLKLHYIKNNAFHAGLFSRNSSALGAALLIAAWTANPAAAQSVAPAGPGVLRWEVQDVTDKMTDKATRKALSDSYFPDDISLEASASCDPAGVEFAFETFRKQDAAPLAWNNDETFEMRIRIGDGETRTTTVNGEYTNEAKILFYDAAASARLIQGALPNGQERLNPVTGILSRMMGGTVFTQLQAHAAGKLADLAGARSIRVELPLADGDNYVVDLNPQDQALKSIVQQCATHLRGQIETKQRNEKEAQRQAGQERLAKAAENRRQAV